MAAKQSDIVEALMAGFELLRDDAYRLRPLFEKLAEQAEKALAEGDVRGLRIIAARVNDHAQQYGVRILTAHKESIAAIFGVLLGRTKP